MAISSKKQPVQKSTDSHTLLLKLKNFGGHNTINHKDRKFFTEQMALLLETGSSMQASLQALQKQLSKPAMVELVKQLKEDVEQGRQFSFALARHPTVFSTTYVNLIAASEAGGYMHEVLEQLQEMDEKKQQLRQTMTSALSYPLFLMFFAFAVVVFVLVVVFPKFADLFSQIADQLPATTVFLMASSRIIQQYWLLLIAGFVATVVAWLLWSRTPHGIQKLDWAKLHLPLIRDIFAQLYLIQSLRVLSLSLGNGVNIIDSLRACRDVVSNSLFQNFIRQVEEHVEQGKGIAIGFQNTSFIPPVVAQMIETGEETGNLPKVLRRLSSYYEAELTNKLQTLSRLAEPFMLLVMGGVVGLIVSSLILPIFKLSRAVG
ncbi:MAG: type II secretion system F family protein [Gammaproteobacteria bacterium]|nr:type II secretion system F family protein [Gammaproteobacteria bacterium]